MGSQTKIYLPKKLLGQVYTPDFIVKKILDDIDYQGDSILAKHIIDPACGDGRFLIEIVKRIIEYSSKEDLAYHLSFVYGWDIDENAINQCVKNLNQLIEEYKIEVDWSIKIFDWKIKAEDSLRKIETSAEQINFDFIVGNPPYIRIQHLDLEQRKYIQTHYQFCKSGSTDIYIAFFELCYHLLNKEGICGLITPNTYLYTQTAKYMRSYFASHIKKITQIKKITNYGVIQLFQNATTYSAITIFTKTENENFVYEQAIGLEKYIQRVLKASEIIGKPIWQLSITDNQESKGEKLGNISHIHVGITTLCDKAYIFSNVISGKTHYIVYSKLLGKKIKVETAILKPIIKGSTYKKGDSVKEYILFPYEKIDGKHQIISEEKLKNKFPFAYEYLLSIKSELDKRDNGAPNPVAWYAFGRSQGLDTSFGKKIIFSPMNKEPNFVYSDNEEASIYSGYLIKYQGDNDKLLKQLNSPRMKDFVAVSSRDFRGGYKAYNKRVIENFVIDMEELA